MGEAQNSRKLRVATGNILRSTTKAATEFYEKRENSAVVWTLEPVIRPFELRIQKSKKIDRVAVVDSPKCGDSVLRMAFSVRPSVCWVATISSPQPKRRSKPNLLRGLFDGHQCDLQLLSGSHGRSIKYTYGTWRGKEKIPGWTLIQVATSDDSYGELKPDASDTEHGTEDIVRESISQLNPEGTGGKPGLISFYGYQYGRRGKMPLSGQRKNQQNLLWFVGPTVLVASFIFPSLYLRRILSTLFEDSLVTDFLILFFTEALFYCGVAVFLLLIDYLQRPRELLSSSVSYGTETNHLGHRISSVTVLVLSLIIPMVTMGLVWPWTGPAASATLAPYLVGIVVQFAFEQYARYRKSPSWSAIPIIFQVYRLHQLNRAAQLVTALSFTVRGAETTSYNLSISSSLGTLLNVLQFLGVICIWSLSSFIMRSIPSAGIHEQ
ncbi:hypothetical protein NE237_019627 [Protea cynaroides]|uniref:Uncharacterized protein n=1 Tax=Protea cynaroides TaxID=273540 RepID=A0A9Q0K1V2_9MAGN|nr:hypothetical protein NE237_019627 [Protea cynaroides]